MPKERSRAKILRRRRTMGIENVASRKRESQRTPRHRDWQPSSPLSAPLTPRDVYADQVLNRSLGEKSEGSRADRNPLPALPWTESDKLWTALMKKDADSLERRSCDMFLRHPSLRPKMRSILLDWIMEVCEVYKLHRETYYLTVDYLDRYLTASDGVLKSELQLIGITCLFTASKVEEIHPPKVAELAYVTDGACQANQIIEKELSIIHKVEWFLSTMTAHAWLSFFLQLCPERAAGNFVFKTCNALFAPRHPLIQYLMATRLLDLAVLDESSLEFSYCTLATCSIYLSCPEYKDHVLSISGLSLNDVSPCLNWMVMLHDVLKEEGGALRSSALVAPAACPEESYLLQTRVVDLSMLEKAQLRIQERDCLSSESPMTQCQSSSLLLTPPSSSKKI